MRANPKPKKPSAEKHHKKATTVDRPLASWFPREDAGWLAWGKAAERAYEEYRIAEACSRSNSRDEKLRDAMIRAAEIRHYTHDRSYPPGLDEGIANLHSGSSDDIERCIAYLEADLYVFGSGYIKSDIIKRLKKLDLKLEFRRRLQNVVINVIKKGFRREFKDYCRLARHVHSEGFLLEVEKFLKSNDPNLALRGKWVLDACRQKTGTKG